MLCRCERVPDRRYRPGTAFTERRFYPPGRVKQFHGRRCEAREWCAALTIGSLSEDPVNGITLNPACRGEIRGGIGYVRFVFLTRSGTPIGPPNPLQFSSATPGGAAYRRATQAYRALDADLEILPHRQDQDSQPGRVSPRRCYPAGGGCWPAGRSLPVSRSATNTFCSMCQSSGCLAIPSSNTLASCWVMAAIFSCPVPVSGTGISW